MSYFFKISYGIVRNRLHPLKITVKLIYDSIKAYDLKKGCGETPRQSGGPETFV